MRLSMDRSKMVMRMCLEWRDIASEMLKIASTKHLKRRENLILNVSYGIETHEKDRNENLMCYS